MKTIDHSHVRRKVNHVIGSLALSGIVVTRKAKADMLRIAMGRSSAEEIKRQLIDQYRCK